MKGKICTNSEYTEMADLNAVDASVEGKFGRLILHCYKDDAGMDRFDVILEPKPNRPEPASSINVGRERIIICHGLLDFENVAKLLTNQE